MSASINEWSQAMHHALKNFFLWTVISSRASSGPSFVLLISACILLSFGSPTVGAQTDPEPNNTPAQALPLVLPFNSAGGAISSSEDIDYYKFSAHAGQEVTVWLLTTTMDSPLVPIIGLYDSTGKLIAYNDSEWNARDSCYCGDALFYIKTPATGVYFLSVTSAAHFKKQPAYQGGETGPYELYLLTTFGGGIGDGNEPNDSRETATPITLPYSSHFTNLIYFGDIDWYRFTAQKGKRISIDVDALELKSTPGGDPVARTRIGVFDQSGRMLAASSAGEDPDSGFTQDPALTFEAPRDGTYFVAVTGVSDTQFVTAFRNPEFEADPYVNSRNGQIGFYRIEINQEQSLLFSQIANGLFGDVSFATSIILMNTADTPLDGRVNFFHPDGTPMEQSIIAPGAPGGTYRFSLPAGGSTIVKTSGLGPGTSGYAVVTSTAALGGSAVFSQYASDGTLMTEAAVEVAPAMAFFGIPVEVGGGFNTGIAIASAQTNNSPAHLYVTLINSAGAMTRTRNLVLDPGTQVSLFVGGANELFPDISNFQGSLQVLSDLPLSAVALRTSPKTLTTLQPVALNQSFQPAKLVFPQFIAGTLGGSDYRSKIILTNPGYFPINGTIDLTRSDGSPMAVTLSPDLAPGRTFTIPPQGTLFLETPAKGNFQAGFATVNTDHGIGGVVIYAQSDDSSGRLLAEVAVAPAAAYRSFMVFAQSENGYNTGLALANLSPSDAAIEFKLQPSPDGVSMLSSEPLKLNAGKQMAESVAGADQIFPEFSGRGTLRVTSTQPIAAVALRFTGATMTTLPLIPVP